MQHHDYDPKEATITAEEAVKMTWVWCTVGTLKTVSDLYRGILDQPALCPADGVYSVMGHLAALWNAGRVQGIREERERQRKKKGGSK